MTSPSSPNLPQGPEVASVTEITPDAAQTLAANPGTLALPVSEITNEAKISVYLNKLLSSTPLLEKTLELAVIEEEKTIDKQDALKYLLMSALADGIDPDALVITEEWKDKNNNLLKLEGKAVDPQTGNYKLLTYQIKRDQNIDETNVDISSYDKDEEYPHSADVFAKYVGGQWSVLDNSRPKGQKWVVQK